MQNPSVQQLMSNPEALQAIMQIQQVGFPSINPQPSGRCRSYYFGKLALSIV